MDVQDPPVAPPKEEKPNDVNILLLGQTGVGKSTFINGFVNYLRFNEFEMAEKEDLITLITSHYNFVGPDYQIKELVTRSATDTDQNETLETGTSQTKGVKSYLLKARKGNARVRLIDTPGGGDTGSVTQDIINVENILSFIETIDELHAICILLNPKDTRSTVFFEYCIQTILCNLDKSAARNIVFIFTNSKDTNFQPGETYPILKKTLENISERQNVDIPMTENNIFCIDNVALKYLVAFKNNIKADDVTRPQAKESWVKSTNEVRRLLGYIEKIEPHPVKNIHSIHEARNMLNQLVQPLAEISDLIENKIRLLDRQKNNLQKQNQSLEELKKNLYIPSIDLKITELTLPSTACLSCATVYTIEGLKKYDYKHCHTNCQCFFGNTEILGHPDLLKCKVMDNRKCTECFCDFSSHMHVCHGTKVISSKNVDQNVKSNIDTLEKALKEAEDMSNEIQTIKDEMIEEKSAILRIAASFANFLEENALSPFNDCYQKYIEYCLEREHMMGSEANQDNIRQFEDLLKEYYLLREAFNPDENDDIPNTFEIENAIDTLFDLKYTGSKIEELYNSLQENKNKEFVRLEYQHPTPVSIPIFKQKVNKSRQKKAKKNNQSSQSDGKKEAPPTYEESQNKHGSRVPHNRNFGNNQPRNLNQYPPPLLDLHLNQPFVNNQPSYAYQNQPPNDQYGPQYNDNQQPYANQPPYVHQPPYVNQPPYGNQPPYDNQAKYDQHSNLTVNASGLTDNITVNIERNQHPNRGRGNFRGGRGQFQNDQGGFRGRGQFQNDQGGFRGRGQFQNDQGGFRGRGQFQNDESNFRGGRGQFNADQSNFRGRGQFQNDRGNFRGGRGNFNNRQFKRGGFNNRKDDDAESVSSEPAYRCREFDNSNKSDDEQSVSSQQSRGRGQGRGRGRGHKTYQYYKTRDAKNDDFEHVKASSVCSDISKVSARQRSKSQTRFSNKPTAENKSNPTSEAPPTIRPALSVGGATVSQNSGPNRPTHSRPFVASSSTTFNNSGTSTNRGGLGSGSRPIGSSNANLSGGFSSYNSRSSGQRNNKKEDCVIL